MARRLRAKRRGMGVVVWYALGLVGSQIALVMAIEHWRPDWCDPEYGNLIRQLHHRQAEAPRKPLVLVLGSSRVGRGFATDMLSAGPVSDGSVEVFGLPMVGGGPFMELLMLRRMVALGVKPESVVVEVLP